MEYYGCLDVFWGDVNCFVWGEINMFIDGGLDMLWVIYFVEICEDG